MGRAGEPYLTRGCMPLSFDLDDDDVAAGEQWYIIITCESDSEQRELLEDLLERGVICRALTL